MSASWPVREPARFSDLPRSLATASVGDRVRVERLQLAAVSAMCRDRGISVGDRLDVLARSDESVFVRNGDGPPARLPRPYAYYVKVRQLGRETDAT